MPRVNLLEDTPAVSDKVLKYVTSIPFTSPVPVKDILFFIPKPLPPLLLATALCSSVTYDNTAEPDTVNSAALADTATRDPARAVKPIFLKLFIITPFIVN